jgi:hypothetical protein
MVVQHLTGRMHGAKSNTNLYQMRSIFAMV